MRPTIPPPNLRLSPTCADCAYVGGDGVNFPDVQCLLHGQEVFYANVCDDYQADESVPNDHPLAPPSPNR